MNAFILNSYIKPLKGALGGHFCDEKEWVFGFVYFLISFLPVKKQRVILWLSKY